MAFSLGSKDNDGHARQAARVVERRIADDRGGWLVSLTRPGRSESPNNSCLRDARKKGPFTETPLIVG